MENNNFSTGTPVTTIREHDIRNIRNCKLMKHESLTIENVEFPLFNTCTHTMVDLYHEKKDDETKTNNMHTLSMRLPNGDFLTLSDKENDSAVGSGCIDIQYYGSKKIKMLEYPSFFTLIYEEGQNQ